MKRLFLVTVIAVTVMSMLSCCAVKQEEAETEEATEQEQENAEPEQQKTYGL